MESRSAPCGDHELAQTAHLIRQAARNGQTPLLKHLLSRAFEQSLPLARYFSDEELAVLRKTAVTLDYKEQQKQPTLGRPSRVQRRRTMSSSAILSRSAEGGSSLRQHESLLRSSSSAPRGVHGVTEYRSVDCADSIREASHQNALKTRKQFAVAKSAADTSSRPSTVEDVAARRKQRAQETQKAVSNAQRRNFANRNTKSIDEPASGNRPFTSPAALRPALKKHADVTEKKNVSIVVPYVQDSTLPPVRVGPRGASSSEVELPANPLASSSDQHTTRSLPPEFYPKQFESKTDAEENPRRNVEEPASEESPQPTAEQLFFTSVGEFCKETFSHSSLCGLRSSFVLEKYVSDAVVHLNKELELRIAVADIPFRTEFRDAFLALTDSMCNCIHRAARNEVNTSSSTANTAEEFSKRSGKERDRLNRRIRELEEELSETRATAERQLEELRNEMRELSETHDREKKQMNDLKRFTLKALNMQSEQLEMEEYIALTNSVPPQQNTQRSQLSSGTEFSMSRVSTADTHSSLRKSRYNVPEHSNESPLRKALRKANFLVDERTLTTLETADKATSCDDLGTILDAQGRPTIDDAASDSTAYDSVDEKFVSKVWIKQYIHGGRIGEELVELCLSSEELFSVFFQRLLEYTSFGRVVSDDFHAHGLSTALSAAQRPGSRSSSKSVPRSVDADNAKRSVQVITSQLLSMFWKDKRLTAELVDAVATSPNWSGPFLDLFEAMIKDPRIHKLMLQRLRANTTEVEYYI